MFADSQTQVLYSEQTNFTRWKWSFLIVWPATLHNHTMCNRTSGESCTYINLSRSLHLLPPPKTTTSPKHHQKTLQPFYPTCLTHKSLTRAAFCVMDKTVTREVFSPRCCTGETERKRITCAYFRWYLYICRKIKKRKNFFVVWICGWIEWRIGCGRGHCMFNTERQI